MAITREDHSDAKVRIGGDCLRIQWTDTEVKAANCSGVWGVIWSYKVGTYFMFLFPSRLVKRGRRGSTKTGFGLMGRGQKYNGMVKEGGIVYFLEEGSGPAQEVRGLKKHKWMNSGELKDMYPNRKLQDRRRVHGYINHGHQPETLLTSWRGVVAVDTN